MHYFILLPKATRRIVLGGALKRAEIPSEYQFRCKTAKLHQNRLLIEK